MSNRAISPRASSIRNPRIPNFPTNEGNVKGVDRGWLGYFAEAPVRIAFISASTSAALAPLMGRQVARKR